MICITINPQYSLNLSLTSELMEDSLLPLTLNIESSICIFSIWRIFRNSKRIVTECANVNEIFTIFYEYSFLVYITKIMRENNTHLRQQKVRIFMNKNHLEKNIKNISSVKWAVKEKAWNLFFIDIIFIDNFI